LEIDTKEKPLVELDWQVGSKVPPRVCLCCGIAFNSKDRKMMGPYYDAPYIWICKSCHSKDYLHSPDKVYSKFDLKSVVTGMNKSIKSTRNEQSANTKLSHYRSNETDRIFLGFADSNKTKIGTPLKYIPLADLKLDSNNVRFQHIGVNLTDAEIDELIWNDPDTIKLYKDIQNTLGIIEPLYIDSNNVVLEGNRRLACLRKICREIRNDVIRDIPLAYMDPIPCRVMPVELYQSVKDEFLARIHIGGKKGWRPLDQASHLYDLHHVHGKSLELLSEITSLTNYTVLTSIRAFELTNEYHRKYPRDDEWVSKFSYFFELIKKPDLQDWLRKKGNIHMVMKWIAGGQIEKGDEIRKIPKIVRNGRMLNKMKKAEKIADVLAVKPVKPITVQKIYTTTKTSNKVSSRATQKRQKPSDEFLDLVNEAILKSEKIDLNKVNLQRLKELRKIIDRIIEKK
jgi:hypothetical protein